MSKKIQIKARGDYAKFIEYGRTHIFTKQEYINFGVEKLGKTASASAATVGVMLSACETSKHGDPRGSVSNPFGHMAYFKRLNRKVVNGVKEAQRYQFRFRAEKMETLKRKVKVSVEATKDTTEITEITEITEVTNTKANANTKAKAKTKVTA